MTSYMDAEYVPWPFMENPKYRPYWFETFDPDKSRKWLWDNWKMSVYATAAYIVLIFIGQQFMKNRQPFGLRKVLALWNFFLAIFSTLGFLRTGPDLWNVLTGPDGFHRSVCIRSDKIDHPISLRSVTKKSTFQRLAESSNSILGISVHSF
jgi:hypothetical protein